MTFSVTDNIKKHTRDVFSVLQIDTDQPDFSEIEAKMYQYIKNLTYEDNRYENDKGTFDRGTHGTTCYYDMNLFKVPEYRPLMMHIMSNIYKTYRKWVPEVKFNARQAWWTVYGPGAYIPRHTHPNSQISGAYYFKQPPGAGPITFFNPLAPLINHLGHPDLIFETAGEIDIVPETGTLLMFPGWLEHETGPNQDTEDKIIVSFNLTIDEG